MVIEEVAEITPEQWRQLLGKRLRLVDNRIVAGESNWMSQPTTCSVLHPKQNKASHRETMRIILDLANHGLRCREEEETKKAGAECAYIALSNG